MPNDEYSLYQFVSWDGEGRIKMTVTTRLVRSFATIFRSKQFERTKDGG